MRRHKPKAPRDEQVELVRLQHDADLGAVLKTPEGRRFVYRLCFDTCAILAGTFTGNSETFWREGKRSVGVFLWAEATRVSPADAVRAHEEAVLSQQQAALRQAAEDAQKAHEADEERDE